jgi:hypothetical protein
MAGKDVVPGGAEALSSVAGLTLDNSNYTLSGATGSVAVTPNSKLAIVAVNQSGACGASYNLDGSPDGFMLSGLQGADRTSGISETVSLNGSPASGTIANTQSGVYAITPSAVLGVHANDYTITYLSTGALTINPRPVVLAGTQTYSGATSASGSNLKFANLARIMHRGLAGVA